MVLSFRGEISLRQSKRSGEILGGFRTWTVGKMQADENWRGLSTCGESINRGNEEGKNQGVYRMVRTEVFCWGIKEGNLRKRDPVYRGL